MAETQQYIIRTEGFANSYGLGTEVAPGCTLFKDNGQPGGKDYNMTRAELNARLAKSRVVIKGRQ